MKHWPHFPTCQLGALSTVVARRSVREWLFSGLTWQIAWCMFHGFQVVVMFSFSRRVMFSKFSERWGGGGHVLQTLFSKPSDGGTSHPVTALLLVSGIKADRLRCGSVNTGRTRIDHTGHMQKQTSASRIIWSRDLWEGGAQPKQDFGDDIQ